ncbi:hypothetical protein [Aliarcobacter cryaerophilus]|jgi:hypothetical protein|uniref:hypothetical protein n=1 Tax=Aliarcobacter cryaerophilus TaxID=28198 RepID=UPI0021B4589E|nr:hypothetical protein [Aliarcobacter cryaerophilus]MCT7433513.1 hypothetical protein [Aliarcobacter cryaerophilus]
MNKFKKIENQKYIEKTKNMSDEDKRNYEILLNLQSSFESLVNELHVKLFPEEFDFYYDSSVDANRRRLGENPMSEAYINRMNEKRVRLGFLPLSENGYSQDSEATLEYCKKLITNEIDYKTIK